MRLFVDGIIFSLQKKGGISRIFLEILPSMCKIDSSLQLSLLVQGCDRNILPQHERLSLVPQRQWPLFSGILGKILIKIERLLYLSALSRNIPAVWYSSYYTLPSGWNGPTVVLVADLIHELYPELFTGPKNDEFRLRKMRCITGADAVICISDTTRRDVISFYKIDPLKAHVALLAYSEVFKSNDRLEAQAVEGINKPFLLYVGPRVHYKNYDLFIKTYAQWSKDKEIDVVLVGPPFNKEEKDDLDNLGIKDRVRLFNEVNDEHLAALYHQARAFVYPSLYEGFGIPLLEAMACGCPVVASDIPSSREIAKDAPFYFPPQDGKGLMHALDLAMQGRDRARIEKGQEICAAYSWEKTARQTLDIFDSVLKGKT